MNELIMEVLYKNELTCPECGYKQSVEMLSLESPTVYCCDSCNEIIQSNEFECCICCSYGAVKCPAEQVRRN